MEGPAKFLESLWVFLEDIFEHNIAAEGGVVVLELLPCFQVTGLSEFSHRSWYLFGVGLRYVGCLKVRWGSVESR